MSLLPPWPSGPDAQVRLAPLTNSEHHTSRLFACSPLQLYPEVWYHTTTEIKVGDQTWIQSGKGHTFKPLQIGEFISADGGIVISALGRDICVQMI